MTVLIRWGPGGGPRNVLIRRSDGQLVVRPFRGLRKNPRLARAEAVVPDQNAARITLGYEHAAKDVLSERSDTAVEERTRDQWHPLNGSP